MWVEFVHQYSLFLFSQRSSVYHQCKIKILHRVNVNLSSICTSTRLVVWVQYFTQSYSLICELAAIFCTNLDLTLHSYQSVDQQTSWCFMKLVYRLMLDKYTACCSYSQQRLKILIANNCTVILPKTILFTAKISYHMPTCY